MNEANVRRYLDKSGDEGIYTDNLIENEHGFAAWKVFEDKLVILHMYGNGKYWMDVLTKKAKELGLKKLYAGTRRNPKAFIRRFDCKVVGYILEKEI